MFECITITLQLKQRGVNVSNSDRRTERLTAKKEFASGTSVN